jgi:hypothetical protein
VFAVATSLLLYVPCVCVTVKLSPVATPESEKFAEAKVALVLPSYGLVGLPMIEAVTVAVVICPAPLAVVGKS